jgi:hypothetical protein
MVGALHSTEAVWSGAARAFLVNRRQLSGSAVTRMLLVDRLGCGD